VELVAADLARGVEERSQAAQRVLGAVDLALDRDGRLVHRVVEVRARALADARVPAQGQADGAADAGDQQQERHPGREIGQALAPRAGQPARMAGLGHRHRDRSRRGRLEGKP
jgi:hypothetical protein